MKCLVLITIVVAVCTAKILIEPIQSDKEGDRYFYFPGDGDGIVHLVDSQEPIDYAFLAQLRQKSNNAYWLYTRSNPTTPQILQHFNESSIKQSNMDFKKVTVFFAHGWRGNGNNEMNKVLTEAFLKDGDVNAIVLDWNELSNKRYTTAKAGVNIIGKDLGRFVNWLAELGLNYKQTHLVGFSLGGHLVGNAGRETASSVQRITGLDPAGPLWGSDTNRIVKTDGQYVEIIHTNTRLLGYTDPCGDADFYPNGGSGQPGCFLNVICSHSRAYHIMASTVKNRHLFAKKCKSYSEASNDKCTGEQNPMGNSDLTKSKTGIFRVNTDSKYPYTSTDKPKFQKPILIFSQSKFNY